MGTIKEVREKISFLASEQKRLKAYRDSFSTEEQSDLAKSLILINSIKLSILLTAKHVKYETSTTHFSESSWGVRENFLYYNKKYFDAIVNDLVPEYKDELEYSRNLLERQTMHRWGGDCNFYVNNKAYFDLIVDKVVEKYYQLGY